MTRNTLLSWGVAGCALLSLGAGDAVAAEAVKTVPLTTGVSIRLGSSEKNGCAWGDLDIINFELEASKAKGLLVTLEPVDGSGAAQSKSILGLDLTKGFVASFTKPAAGLYGIFVCKDSGKKGRCSGKPVAEPHALLNQYLHTGPSAAATAAKGPEGKDQPPLAIPPTLAGEPSDKIYYFAPIVVDKDGVTFVATSTAPNEYAELGKKLGKSGDAALTKAQSIGTTLHSVQPEYDGTRLVANLPRLNKDACSMNRRIGKK